MSGFLGGGNSNGHQSQQAPLAGANIQSSAYGLPVPLIYGRNRVAANLIWYGAFVATPHTQKQSGGKGGGGGGGKSTTYTYTASMMWGLGEGAFTSINNVWKDKDAAKSMAGFTTFLGGAAQSPWSYLTTFAPSQALNYRGHAYVARATYDLGDNASIGNHSFDVTALLPYNAGTIDGANPKFMIADYLTNINHGAGFLGSLIGDLSQFSNYCIANNFFISPVYLSQSEARQHITDLMGVLNCGVFFSDGKLKVVPFSDTNVTGNGINFIANATPVFDLTDDDFLDLQQPVKVQRTAASDAFNQVQIEFLDKTNSYNKAVATASDQASIEIYGLKPQSIIEAHMITDAATARTIAQLILQRILYTRNMYEFKIGWKFCQLEPCDYVTLTDTRLGLANTPVRVLAIEEDETGVLTITAEDAPSGVSHSALYDPQPSSGYVVDFNIACGQVVAPAFFEVPANQSLSGLAIGIAVTGNNPNWGGCDVYVSNDGISYAQIKTANQPARYGAITNSITAAVDQVAAVSLVGNGGQIIAGSATDAANDSTACVIGNEYVDYTTAALVTANKYNLTLAVRGAHGTAPAAHSPAEKFIRVDGAIVYSDTLDLSFIGKTLYFKFLSFNIYGGAKTDLASATAYTYTVNGYMAKLAKASVTSFTAALMANGVLLQWANLTLDYDSQIEIWRGTNDVPPQVAGSTASIIMSAKASIESFVDYTGASGVFYYFIRTKNAQGFPSAFSAPLTASAGSVGGVGGIEIVLALPTTGNFDGRVVYLTAADGLNPAKLIYRFDASIGAFTNKVTGNQLTDGSVIAQKINVAKLAAISADMGDVTAGSLNISNKFIVTAAGVATIKSATSGARLEIVNDVIRVYDAAGVLRVKLGNLA